MVRERLRLEGRRVRSDSTQTQWLSNLKSCPVIRPIWPAGQHLSSALPLPTLVRASERKAVAQVCLTCPAERTCQRCPPQRRLLLGRCGKCCTGRLCVAIRLPRLPSSRIGQQRKGKKRKEDRGGERPVPAVLPSISTAQAISSQLNIFPHTYFFHFYQQLQKK